MVGRGGAEEDVVGQRLVKDGAARAAEGRAPAMAADALVREGAVQRAPRRQVPIEGELGVHTGERRTGVRRREGWSLPPQPRCPWVSAVVLFPPLCVAHSLGFAPEAALGGLGLPL